MLYKVKFIVFGKIHSKGRPRFKKVGNFVTTYTDKKTVDYEELIRTEFLRQKYRPSEKEYTGAVKMVIWVYFEPANSISKKLRALRLGQPHIKKSDIDNIIKIVADSLNGVAYKDDCQIANIEAHKRYDNTERIEVEIEYRAEL